MGIRKEHIEMANRKQKIKGCIFDFNGTMFFDGAKHDQAWRSYLKTRIGRDISKAELMAYVYGRPSRMILTHFLGSGLSDAEIAAAADEKESCYRALCMEEAESLHLANGLSGFLDGLQKAGYSMAIASAANKDNMDFYFDVFRLDRWFTWDRVIYDDGTLRGKPEPDYFLEAAKRLKLPPLACHVFEDSVSGLLAANRAGAGWITAVYGDSDYTLLKEQKLADTFIRDYEGLTESFVD